MPLPTVFALFQQVLGEIARGVNEPRTVLAFEAKLLVELGLQPEVGEARLSPGSQQIYARLAADDWPALARLALSTAQVGELRQFLHGFLIYHLGKIPRGRAEALAPESTASR